MRGYEDYSKEEKQNLIDYWEDYIKDIEDEMNSANTNEPKWILIEKIKEAKRDIERLNK